MLDHAEWHKPGKTNLLLTICGTRPFRWALIEVACVFVALAVIDTLCWLLFWAGQ